MRTNLPVTQSEYALRDDHLMVSKTDLKGQIVYVNKDFLEVSGFTEAELLGQPHNMVRHPDMPSEAFADMWQTLKEGRPWTGYVKNRCKNGDFYWVLANAAPITENGQVTGFISVRRQATQQAIAEHEALYQRFREKRQGNLVIKYGQVIKPSLWDFKNNGIGTKIWAGIGVIVLFSAIAIGSSWQGMDKTQVRFASYLQNEQKLLDDYSEMYAQGLQMGQALRNIILDPANDKAYKNLLQARQDFKTHMAEALAVPGLDAEQRKTLETITTLSDKQFAIQSTIVDMAKEGKLAEAQQLLNKEETPLWRKYKEYLLDGRKSLTAKSLQGQEEVAQMVANASRVSFFSGLFALLIAGFAAALLGKMIRRPLQEMDDTFTNVLQGNYSNVIDIARNDEIGKAMQGLQIMQTRMGFEVVESKRQADEMTRIKIALDCVGTPVRITDTEGTVIYANKALFAALRRLEPMLKAQKPGFSVDSFIGSRIGDLYANPDAENQRLANLSAPAEIEKQIGDRTFSVMTSPVFTDKGERLGTVGEWLDRTDEILVEKEISEIVENAAQGDLNGRIELTGKDGFFAALSGCVNNLLDTTQKALLATSAVLGRVAGGDLTRTIEQDYSGIFGQLKGDTNTTVEHLREVVGQIIEATDAINIAAKEIASGNQDLSNRTEEQASSLEETASSMDQLTTMVKQNADNARNANELASTAQQVAVKGGEIVSQVVSTMSAIHQSSQKIADIIGVIDNIAFQTNILALNAAVEAARAGEQGRGFAVVATEVRNLSKRSADAAKEIKDLISDSVGKVQVGDQLVAQAGNTMAEVVSSIKRVATIMAEISHASREQSQGIEQVSQAVGQMDGVTQQNAALVEQAAAAAESLEEQASSLVQAVRRFKLSETDRQPLAALPHSKAPQHLPPPVTSNAPAPRQAVKLPAPQDAEDEWAEF